MKFGGTAGVPLTDQERIMRFWANVRTTGHDGCWVWMGRLNKGYGKVGYSRLTAHGTAYGWMRGEVPKGLQLDHLCRNRSCVNPDHLEPVTCRENVLRGVGFAAQNKQKTHCPSGHQYNAENTKYCRRGKRYCRECSRIGKRERRAARRLLLPVRALPTHCYQGHSLEQAGGMRRKSGTIICKKCRRIVGRRYDSRKRREARLTPVRHARNAPVAS